MAPSILTILYNDYIRPKKRAFLILTMVVIFGVAAYYAYKMFAKPLLNEGLGNGSDVANHNNRRDVEIYLFYADWCPHCKKAKPEWNTFKSSYDGKEVNGFKIKCIGVDCTDGTSPYIQQYEVNGYPTLVLVKDGNKIAFDSKITTDNLTTFVNTVLQ